MTQFLYHKNKSLLLCDTYANPFKVCVYTSSVGSHGCWETVCCWVRRFGAIPLYKRAVILVIAHSERFIHGRPGAFSGEEDYTDNLVWLWFHSPNSVLPSTVCSDDYLNDSRAREGLAYFLVGSFCYRSRFQIERV